MAFWGSATYPLLSILDFGRRRKLLLLARRHRSAAGVARRSSGGGGLLGLAEEIEQRLLVIAAALFGPDGLCGAAAEEGHNGGLDRLRLVEPLPKCRRELGAGAAKDGTEQAAPVAILKWGGDRVSAPCGQTGRCRQDRQSDPRVWGQALTSPLIPALTESARAGA